MRYGLAGMVAALGACSFNVDYTGTLFACDPDGSCPAHYVCQDMRCLPTEPPPSACAMAIGAGDSHSCAIRKDGTAWCWGSNGFGQLGDGTTDDRITPVEVSAGPGTKLPTFTAIVGGDEHTCALGGDSSVWCWGRNDSGQLGSGSSDFHTPVLVSNLSDATALASGAAHTCAIRRTGDVACWGNNEAGQVGNGGSSNQPQPLTLGGPHGVTAIAAGGDSTCAIDGNKQLWCWGDNQHGQLGDGTRTPHPTPTQAAYTGVAGVAVGDGFACVMAAGGGKVTCFGQNFAGQLGTPVDNAEHVNGVPVAFAGTAVSIIARTDFACLTDDHKRVWCWGDNENFQLADTTGDDRFVPVLTTYGDSSTVVAGGAHTCALSSAGGITCSGFNSRGQLGNGRRTSQATPHVVSGIQDAMTITAGAFQTCATVRGGTVMCWGGNEFGELGDGTAISRSAPAPVSSLAGVQQITAGIGHTCAVTQGVVECWGANFNGQLGDATNYTRGYALAAAGPSNAIQVAAGGNTTCALAGNAVSCWGQGGAGQLGNAARNDSNAPVAVMLMKSDISTIAVGDGHACAVHADMTVSCWGAGGGGQLGDNGFSNSSTPVVAGGLSGVDQITAGGAFTCAHTAADGGVWCWGAADNGELGYQTSSNVGAPRQLSALSGTMKVDAGGGHACAIMPGGALVCWGASFLGQIGDGGYDHRITPASVAIPGSVGVVDVSAGDQHTCAVLANGSVACWGDDRAGQLGDGILADQTPVAPLLPCP
jgi:alpha-tubulin suppressor-like RCC1 family protein